MAWDYKRNFAPPELDAEGGVGRREAVHARGALRLLRLFERNGGIYIKVGQHLSTLEYILPVEYCEKLAALHNQAPRSSYAEVASVLRAELLGGGGPLESLFSQLDPEPLASASLAQVHRAVRRDTGEEVAIKVQHAQLRGFIDSDLFVISCAVRAIKYIFPEFDFDWIADELRINLPKELDFTSEAHNAERIAKYLSLSPNLAAGVGAVRIPRIHWDLSSRRVLTMEFLPGAKATNRAYLLRHGIAPSQVASLITRCFSEMIFIHGFVHCDPHPGNLLVRPRPPSQSAPASPIVGALRDWYYDWLRGSRPFELILLDHGLYRELPEDFRRAYAGLWKAVIDASEPEIRHYAGQVGGGEAYRLFSCILTQRSWQSVASGAIMEDKSAAEAIEIFTKAPHYFGQVADLLARLPRPLLLLLKTNDLLRHLERQLAGSSYAGGSQTFTIMGHYCIEALAAEEGPSASAWDALWRHLWRRWAHLRLYCIEAILYLHERLRLGRWVGIQMGHQG